MKFDELVIWRMVACSASKVNCILVTSQILGASIVIFILGIQIDSPKIFEVTDFGAPHAHLGALFVSQTLWHRKNPPRFFSLGPQKTMMGPDASMWRLKWKI